MRTVVFDLDGTLADTGADLIAAANACFTALGHGALLDPAADKAVAFHGGRAMLRLGFKRLGQASEAAVDAEYPKLLDHYAANIAIETRLYPGAVAAVEGLRAGGARIAICTNKPAALAEDLMRRLGARDLFDALVGADTLPVRKPDPAPYRAAVERAGGDAARSCLVGDTRTDVETARAAGVPVALVGFGPVGAAVADLAPDAVLGRFEDLPAWVARVLPD